MGSVPRSSFIPPCLPTPDDRLPKDEGWLFEVKFDGYRMQVHKAGERVMLFTRNGADWTERFSRLAAELASLPCTSAIIDAELVHPDGFAALHRAAHKRTDDEFVLSAFDVMQLDGNDLRAVRLEDRKRRLWPFNRAGEDRLPTSLGGLHGRRAQPRRVRQSRPRRRSRQAQGSIYRSGRSTSWVKVKCPAWREANRNRGELFGEGRFSA